MRSTLRFALIMALASAAPAFSQNFGNFDNSANSTLHGDYFVREVLFSNLATNGVIGAAQSAIGTITFDGAGNYSFTGQSVSLGGQPASFSATGTYAAAANGFVKIQDIIDNTTTVFGGIGAVGPLAIVGSVTESNVDYDVFVAIPAGSGVTNASLSGNYSAGYIGFPNADVTLVRDASFPLAPDGSGNLGTVAVSGYAANLGGTALTQNVAGVTYSLTANGSGTAVFGTASNTQLVSGTMNLYVSADGNLILGGTPGGFDLLVGEKSFSGSASNGSINGVFYMAGLEQPQVDSSGNSDLDGFWGSFNANGGGTSLYHYRLNESFFGNPYDLTIDGEYTVAANATYPVGSYQNTIGASGHSAVIVGSGSLYSAGLALKAQNYTGSGVFLNPLGIVNSGNYAPVTNSIGPNELVTLFGSGLANATVSAPALTGTSSLPTTLGGVQVTINGTAVPLLYVSSGVIGALVPFGINLGSTAYATFQVSNNTVLSNPVTVFVNYTSPGVFSATANGIGPAAMRHNDSIGTPVNASHPAVPNETISIYVNGLGKVNPAVNDGQAASLTQLSSVDPGANVAVFINGEATHIRFAGLAPGFAGLYQINAVVPADAPAGNLSLDLETTDAASNQTSVPVSTGASGTASVQANEQRTTPRALSGRPTRKMNVPRTNNGPRR